MWTTGRRAWLLAAVAAGLSLFAAHGLAGDGFFAEQFADPRTEAMLLETALVYLLFFCVDRIRGRGQRNAARVLLLFGFAFRHLALFSVLMAGFWILMLSLTGMALLYRRAEVAATAASISAVSAPGARWRAYFRCLLCSRQGECLSPGRFEAGYFLARRRMCGGVVERALSRRSYSRPYSCSSAA